MVSWQCLWLVTEHLFAFLAGKYGIPDPPLFCLKASYWTRSRRGSSTGVPRSTENPEELLGDDVEPVPPKFLGKEAIRLREKELLVSGSWGLVLPLIPAPSISLGWTFPGNFHVGEPLAKHFVSQRKIRDKNVSQRKIRDKKIIQTGHQ